MRNQKFVFAHATAENVTVSLVGDLFERRQSSFFDPATRTKVVAPLLNREFQKSFFDEPVPGVRKASSYVIRYFLRRLSDLVAQGHS